ncbi:hypothetical protein [Cupriavidus sp. IDO]|uniref:hypothetical protein n=1 Tax=Cupriavidus sp. IDO TaxID=1539142 RepID=UPI00068D6EBD|nr:hypothetical protein [Cupriavidus sp. IDO]KWR81269.1 hypothetical protein RM96_29020 [Cupriavidus sp. IDO]
MTPVLNLPWPGQALLRALELRIDVSHGPAELERELAAIHDRIRRPGDRLHAMPAVPAGVPGLRLRYREADGEYYVYVEDAARGRLAGYTVFNRLTEVGRRADPCVRAPHSKYAAPYQRRGLATALYRWGLDAGLCLMSGARQSAGANALWQALARHYTLGYVDLRQKTLTYLGSSVSDEVLGDLHTRMVLLGRGWTMTSFSQATGMY